MNATKPTKLETLTARLETAKLHLAGASGRLQPQIDAERARVDQLRATYDKASKAQGKTYETYQATVRAAQARLFPAEVSKQLQAAIQAHVSATCPQADIGRLAREFEARQVAADAEVAASNSAFKTASDLKDKLYREYNIASGGGSKLSKLVQELEAVKDTVASLEKEIERLPRYRQAAKDRRAAEREEAITDEQTQAARALLVDFRF